MDAVDVHKLWRGWYISENQTKGCYISKIQAMFLDDKIWHKVSYRLAL